MVGGELVFFSPATSISVRPSFTVKINNTVKNTKNRSDTENSENEGSEKKEQNEGRSFREREKDGNSFREKDRENNSFRENKEKNAKSGDENEDDNTPGKEYDTSGMYNNINASKRKNEEKMRLRNLRLAEFELRIAPRADLFLVGRKDGTVDLFQVFNSTLFFPYLCFIILLI